MTPTQRRPAIRSQSHRRVAEHLAGRNNLQDVKRPRGDPHVTAPRKAGLYHICILDSKIVTLAIGTVAEHGTNNGPS